MSKVYRESVLHEIGLADADAGAARAQCALNISDLSKIDLATYGRVLGAEVKSAPLIDDVAEAFVGSTAYYFLLVLWPHLYWIVNRAPGGGTWGIGFRNQVDLRFERFEPSLVRVGLWTRNSLEKLADDHEIYDGWDEEVIVRFRFGPRRYEGTFTFGLLQNWRAL